VEGALLPLIFTTVGILIIRASLAGQLARRAALRAPTPVRRVTGPVTVERIESDDSNSERFCLTAGGLRFANLSTDAGRGFFEPIPHTVYYSPRGPELLGAEPAPARPILREIWPQPDWLQANASGQLAPDQRDQLIGNTDASPFITAGVLNVTMIVGIIGVSQAFEGLGEMPLAGSHAGYFRWPPPSGGSAFGRGTGPGAFAGSAGSTPRRSRPRSANSPGATVGIGPTRTTSSCGWPGTRHRHQNPAGTGSTGFPPRDRCCCRRYHSTHKAVGRTTTSPRPDPPGRRRPARATQPASATHGTGGRP